MAYHLLNLESKPIKAVQEPHTKPAAKEGVSSQLIAKILAGQTETQPGRTS
ncbi:MAG: hypothetical protein HYZ26_01990 [Chloroflexi bacterium]|nr:hypothetical protein [Chloroflexota bacterium]